MLQLIEHHRYYSSNNNHFEYLQEKVISDETISEPIYFQKNKEQLCLHIHLKETEAHIENSYFIGLDWVRPWNIPVSIEPKINNSRNKLDYVGMLLEALKESENFAHLEGLMEIKFDEEWISADSKINTQLTPFLFAQFLAVLQRIVRKGLKKDYFNVTENLNSRVKGKILVGRQIKQNVVHNRLTHTVCSYQNFGINTETNRFFKYVLQFVGAQLSNFGDDQFKIPLVEQLNYNLGAFGLVENQKFTTLKRTENNPFYKEYNLAIKLGNQILRLMDHDISKAANILQKYPPYWIDMSKLFELYVFKKLRERFTGQKEVMYHEKVHYQEPDFLINSGNFKAVVDAKYKPRYNSHNPGMNDARQLSGYSRLEKVFTKLGIEEDQIIPVYFIYPSQSDQPSIIDNEKLMEEFEPMYTPLECSSHPLETSIRKAKAYRKMYLQEIKLPFS